ncbi:hypothetical protein HN766_08050 [Candidatus Poribacteria bacterium]|nr:hypothetical protein [Candidatus Poribacteria bacterium]
MTRILKGMVSLALMVVLPIVAVGILVPRVAVEFYARFGLGAWVGLGASVITVAVALAVCTRVLPRRSRRRRRPLRPRVLTIVALMVGYCVYAILSISGANAKTGEVRRELRTLHPCLRLAVGTAVIGDDPLLLTDIAREPDDYGEMGLATRGSSLHYIQDDGYAHAVDLRTKGRSELHNGLTRLYFHALGLHTLRHVGTADHLHVALPISDRR